MTQPDSFILNNFDDEKINNIRCYIGQVYNLGTIIYGSVGFCAKMIANITIGITVKDDIYYKSLNRNDVYDTGLIGKYCGIPIICVPELNEINAIIVPDWTNFWGNYFQKE